MMKFQPPKGTRDFYGQSFVFRKQISETILKVLASYGFEQVQTPVIESLELLQAMAGEEIVGQIYTLTDKGGRKLGLRSDITPAITRLFVETATALPKPMKYSCFDRVYRYERPQEGRYREIYQINAEEFSAPAPVADAEVLACMYACYRAIGLPDVTMVIGYRPLLEMFVASFGISKEQQEEVIRTLDKSNKISEEDFIQNLFASGIRKEQLPRLQEFLTLKGSVSSVLKKTKQFFNKDGSILQYVQELEAITALFKSFGIEQNCLLQLGLARGSEYYTGIIFEVQTTKAAISIGGGGRYDKLVPVFGGKVTPAVGFSIGFDRVMDILQKENTQEMASTQTFIAFDQLDEKGKTQAIAFASQLRDKGENVELNLVPKTISEQTELARKKGAKNIYIFDTENIDAKKVAVINTTTNTRKTVSVPE